MTSKTVLLVSCLATMSVACSEPYDVDPKANEQPAVEEVFLRDTIAVSALSADEQALMSPLDFPADDHVYPSAYFWVRFNKLINGDTVEKTAEEPVTHRQLGTCAPADGNPIELLRGGTPVSSLRTCYSPSDRLVRVEALNDEGSRAMFLAYNTQYTLRATEAIKDKKGTSLTAYEKRVTVGPFEVLSVTSNEDSSQRIFGKAGSPLEVSGSQVLLATDGADGTAATKSLRIVFTGSMTGPGAVSGLGSAKLLDAASNQELSAVDPNATDPANATKKTLFTVNDSTDSEPVSADDPRVVYVYPPSYIVSEGETGFAPGRYTLVLPATVTDDGTVTTDTEQSHLASELRIDFDVQ